MRLRQRQDLCREYSGGREEHRLPAGRDAPVQRAQRHLYSEWVRVGYFALSTLEPWKQRIQTDQSSTTSPQSWSACERLYNARSASALPSQDLQKRGGGGGLPRSCRSRRRRTRGDPWARRTRTCPIAPPRMLPPVPREHPAFLYDAV
jgi:hypothetical protein